MKKSFLSVCLLLLIPMFSRGQAMEASAPMEPMAKNVEFTHVPFLLLRFNPSNIVGYNNTLQFGAEIAPPIGKLSFAFDYGTGKGIWNLNKSVKELQADNIHKELRGEIKAYFSDWYPFYALDRKPFGRYYSIEYINGEYDRKWGIENPEFNWATVKEISHVVHLKWGKHFHLHQHLFLDVYAGLGAGISKYYEDGVELKEVRLINPVKAGFLASKRYDAPKNNKIFFSKTIGVRLAIPL